MSKARLACFCGILSGVLVGASLASAATITVPTDFTDIGDAVDAAGSGDVVYILDGNYLVNSTVTIGDGITLSGESESGVVIDVNVGSGYGLHPEGDDIVLQDFTLNVITPTDQGFVIHASDTPNVRSNLTVQRVTIYGATAGTQRRAGLDVHGYEYVTITDVTSNDATWGTGIQFSACQHVTVTNTSTANNAWGSLAVFVSTYFDPTRPSDDVVIDGDSCTFNEGVVYVEDDANDDDVVSTNITVTGWDFYVRNDQFRADAEEFLFFQDTLALAITQALGFSPTSRSSIEEIATGDMKVASSLTIQAAVDAAQPGVTVDVAAGTYVEQVRVPKDLTIQGAGTASTVIQSPATLTEFFPTGSNDNYPVVFIDTTPAVDLIDLTVDGDGQGNANYRFQGIGFWNAGGSVTNVDVINVIDTPFSGSQHGVGIYAYNDTGGPYAIALANVLVDQFQKTAVALGGDGLTVDLDDVTTVGAGPTDVTAQNGVQIAYGAGGTVDNCVIEGVAYTGADWTASGMLIFEGAGLNVTNVDLDGCQTSIYCQDSDGVFDGPVVTNPEGDAMYAYSSGAKSEAAPRRLAAPFVSPAAKGGSRAPVDVTVSNGSFTGAGVADSWGPTAYGYGPITFSVTNCEVTNWDWGVVMYDFGGASFDADVSQCNIHDNTTYGLYTNAVETVQASCNWWGDLSGPDVPPAHPASGDAVEGDAIYWPWLDGVNGNCTEYGDDSIGALAVDECLTPDNTCVPVTVSFDRTDATASRAVSVTFELSDELMLCTSDIDTDIFVETGAGSWLDGFGNYTAPRYDNGNNSYTVDLSILGTPCGPTTGGQLFTVMVARDPAVTDDAIGTLTVTDVEVRDCANAPLPGIPGAPAEITIDLTSPPVLANLVATQRKTGNDDDGNTLVDVSWDAPGGDAETITIWRKGFGDYPEYDAGAEPTAPVTMANGWTEVATVAATTTTYPDDPDARDFYYYAAYVNDTCGNVSLASDISNGVLSYHLGDVTDGVTNGQGDNLVALNDISHLGFNYGITLTPGDALNYLDVGPTTDMSVDGRPTTDDEVEFEDLLMFAINFGDVSKDLPVRPVPATRDEILARVGTVGGVGSIVNVELMMSGTGLIQGLSVPLEWDAAVVEPLGMQPGDLMDAQGVPALVLAPVAGTVDAAVFGTESGGISGEGRLATVQFRVRAGGDPAIAIGDVIARDGENRPAMINDQATATPPAAVEITQLHRAVPNPFNPTTKLAFDLARSGPVSLRIYNLSGQLVRTVVRADLPAGRYEYRWSGNDDSGRRVASGTYLARLVVSGQVHSQRLSLVK